MKLYTKPVITIDSGLAEGVYAASGAANNNINVQLQNTATWTNTSGQADYTVTLNNLNPANLTIILTFNMDLSAGWCDGASNIVSGKSVSLTWTNAPTTTTVHIQVNSGDITQLQCIGTSYSNANS